MAEDGCLNSGAFMNLEIKNNMKTDGTFTFELGDNVVTTQKIKNDAVTLDKIASLDRGNIIYGNNLNNPTALPLGNADQVLTSNGDDIVWRDASGGINATDSNIFENEIGQIFQGPESKAGIIYIKADQGDDAGDSWKLNAAADGVLTIGSDINVKNTSVAHLTITPNAVVANSTTAVAGNLTVGGNLTLSEYQW